MFFFLFFTQNLFYFNYIWRRRTYIDREARQRSHINHCIDGWNNMVIRARATYDGQPFNRERSVLFTELYNNYHQAVRQIRKDLRLATGKDNTEFSKKFVIEANRLQELITKMIAVAERNNNTFGEDLL